MAKGSKKTTKQRKPLTVSVHGEGIDLELKLDKAKGKADEGFGDRLDVLFDKIGEIFLNRGVGIPGVPSGNSIYVGATQSPDETEDQYHDRVANVMTKVIEGMCDHMLDRGLEIIAAEKTKRAMQVS